MNYQLFNNEYYFIELSKINQLCKNKDYIELNNLIFKRKIFGDNEKKKLISDGWKQNISKGIKKGWIKRKENIKTKEG